MIPEPSSHIPHPNTYPGLPLEHQPGFMISSLFKNRSTRLIGAMFILLGAAVAPSQATTLTGFETYGDMMSGMRVTASFLDGTSESLIWSPNGNRSGGVFSTAWGLNQTGNTYDSRWTLGNYGVGMTSLVIDAIPGNTVFDTYPLLFGPFQTPGSAEGWEFQPLLGLAPTSYAYSTPIDISQGDLFGKLSLYWTNGFTGVMQFRADTDSGSASDPVQALNPVLPNIPPTLYFSAPTIYEGQSASTVIQATDPGEDAITFLLNNVSMGTDFNRSGFRQVPVDFGFFPDNVDLTYTAVARDENGLYSNSVTSVLRVLNLPPAVTDLYIPVIYEGQSASAYISATDPGADFLSFYLNGAYFGTDYNTAGIRAVSADLGYFDDNTYIPYTGHALDKDGAWSAPAYSGLTVLNVAPTLDSFDLSQNVVYEGQSVSALLTATDPGADSQTFFLNGMSIGNDPRTSGTRSMTTDLGPFSTGTYTFTAETYDKDGAGSNQITRILEVLNVVPTITEITQNLMTGVNEVFDFVASAFDPGNKPLTYEWDFDGDGEFDDFAGASGQWAFAEDGIYQVSVRVTDENGGSAYDSFTVSTSTPSPDTGNEGSGGTTTPPGQAGEPVENVPEPSSVLSVLVFGVGGATAAWKRKHKQKTN